MPATRRKKTDPAEVKPEMGTKIRSRKRTTSETENEPDVKMVKQDVVKQEVEDDPEMDIEEEEDEVMDYSKRREENIRMNREFLENLGLNEAKQELQDAARKKPKPASQRGLKREKRPPPAPLERRSSLRLQNKTPEGGELPPEALIRRAAMFTSYEPVDDHMTHETMSETVELLTSRPPAGPLEMGEILYQTCTLDDHKHMTKVFSDLDTKPIKPSTVDLDRFITSMKKTTITERQVVHVVKDRSFSVGFHPSNSKILAASGDKWGRLGIWDVMYKGESDSDGVVSYVPHSRPITCLEFPIASPDKVYTCGYDGSLRFGDLRKEVFQEVYSEPEEEDILLRNFSFTSPHTILVSQNTGCVSLVDIRTSGTNAEHTYKLHHRALRTVSAHPVDTHYFCTGGLEGKLSVWDLRNVKVKNSIALCELQHGKSINSAYFSPVTGKYILSTSMDNRLTIFDSSVVGSAIKTKKAITHDNHTGRWLTGFRAAWHPAREDIFVVGSMNRPREISLFSVEGKKVHSFLNEDNLRSVCSLNAFHPTKDIVVGANSSGRLHLFM